MLFGREPALWIGAINALIAIAVGFGLDISPEQVGLINAGVAALLAVAVRSQVEPTAKPLDERGATWVEVAVVVLVVLVALLLLGILPARAGISWS